MSSIPIFDQRMRKVATFAVVMVVWFLYGTLGYHFIEGWSILDGLYMTVITISTVGFGETHPLSDTGHLFTITLVLSAMGITLFALSEVTAFIVEGEMTGALRRRKMIKQIEKLSDHYILCGAGRTGMYVMQEMQKTQTPFVMIENNPDRAKEMMEAGALVVQGDATQDSILHLAGIDRAAGLLSALPDDRDNLFVVISARALNTTMRIVTKIDDIEARQKFLHSGANTGVSTHFIGGLRMASELIRPAATTFLDTMLRGPGNLRVADAVIADGSKLVGQRLGDIDAFAKAGVLLMSLKHGEDLQFNPSPDTRVQAGDAVIVMGTSDQVADLQQQIKA